MPSRGSHFPPRALSAACGPRFPYLSFPDAYVLLGRSVARYTIRLARVESLREPITWCIIHNAWPVPARPLPATCVYTTCTSTRFSCTPATRRGKRTKGKRVERDASIMDRRERQIRFRMLAFLRIYRGQRRADKRAWMFRTCLLSLSLSLSPCHREDLIDFRRWAFDGGRGRIKRRFLGSLIVENEGRYSLNIRRMESVEVNFERLRGVGRKQDFVTTVYGVFSHCFHENWK